MSAHLLYVEDDESLSFVTRDHLEMHGYRVTHIANGAKVMASFAAEEYDLCLLDVMLPEIDGFELAREIRRRDTQIPILFLTAKSMKEDRLQGLRLGADDYITKPFSIEELILKIEVFLRRTGGTVPRAQLHQIGQYTFDYGDLSLSYKSDTRRLTQKEADLLRYLNDNRNRVVKRAEILEQLWGENDYFLGRSLDVFISRLRKYLREDEDLRIENIHGVGFCFHAEANTSS